jgi:PAS domain S-box-containing protein
MIGQLKETTEALEKSLKEASDYKYALEESCIVAITDQKGIINYANDNFCKISKYSREELIGQDHRIINSGHHSKEFIRNLWVTISRGKIWRGELKNRAKDNTFYWVDTTIVPFLNEQGKPYQYIAIRADITARKLAEEKESFLSMVSHELKTPLTTIKAYVQIADSMLEKKGDADISGIMKRMDSQVNRLTNLVQNLLDFTKIQKGKLVYNEAFFDFNDLVTEVIDDMQKISPTHEIKNYLGKSAALFGDRDRLSQVMNNLISNAVKYSPKAREIVVGTKLQNNGIQLYVKDYGLGISEHEQQNIFEQFYRVNEHSESTFPGMGIGLFICTEIIARQGGKIWVESSVDKGSTFYIWLPFDYRNKLPDVVENDEQRNNILAS